MLDTLLAPLRDSAPGGLPRQQRLYGLLKEAMLDGRLPAALRLPGTRQLAADLGMARNCVVHAYQQLLAEGFLLADRGGTRVAGVRPLAALTETPAPAAGSLSQRAQQLSASGRGESLSPFAPGMADVNAFPWRIWSRYLQQAWGEVSARHLAYAEPGGEPALRQALATFLAARRGVVCAPEQVFIVAGGQVALDACARLLADPGDPVWLEHPGYPAARNTMLAAGLSVVDVPVDGDGMAPDAALWQQRPPRLMYLTPAHQYPLGSVLSLARRLEFLDRLAASGGWLIEDDYDSEFNHARPDARPLPAIQGLRPEAPVIYVGTFSKLLYPGLRIAYMVVPRWAVGAIGEAVSALYRGGQAVEQRALARFLDSGRLIGHLRRMAPVYRERQQRLRQALHEHFGATAEILGGAAGLHLSLRMPAGPADIEIAAEAARRGVGLRPLSRYFAAAPRQNGLLFGYGMVDSARIDELVGRVGEAARAAESNASGNFAA